ncbi:MAG: NYN domain-containing protein, partial [Anaerolineales bacterium]|nr:NYN domain-containing protein [Anaerolineales bacterium]
YFSAYAKHLESSKPQVIQRHKNYIRCLKATGVQVVLGQFKQRHFECRYCHKQNIRHEEKETDVAIGIKLLELFMQNNCDVVVIMTGDTDLAPAVRTAKLHFPNKTICFSFPFARRNNELARLVEIYWKISKEQYQRHQFHDPFIFPNGDILPKPKSW